VLQVGPGTGVPVECVIDSGAVGVSKPDPRIFRIALEAMQVAPADAWYVGDTPAIDVTGARAAGLEPIVMDPYGLHEDADYVRVRSLGEVATLVDAKAPR
jgi:putative hydrolase of the HAD superfamily